MSGPLAQLQAAAALTRPAQWPILTGQFFVGILLMAPSAQGGGCWLNSGSLLVLAVSWACWVMFLNGGTLAFNSSQDRDSGPVAYLPDPPEPPRWLAAASTAWMLAGAALGWWIVGPAFGAVTGFCVLLSVLYSHRLTRWKSVPGLDLAVNMAGYGAGTTAAGLLAGRAAYLIGPDAAHAGADLPLGALSACGTDRWILPALPAGDALSAALPAAVGAGGAGWLVLGFGLLFGSFYPLTQIYQADEDRARGDSTLASALGTAHALRLSLALGVAASAAFAAGLVLRDTGWWIVLPGLALLAWLSHVAIWSLGSPTWAAADHERGMYRALNLWAVVDISLLAAWIF